MTASAATVRGRRRVNARLFSRPRQEGRACPRRSMKLCLPGGVTREDEGKEAEEKKRRAAEEDGKDKEERDNGDMEKKKYRRGQQDNRDK